jgi:misacylated tRNA(Ala) deacylase
MLLCHAEPDLLEFEAAVVDARPGAVALSRTAFYPGGGGQLPDRGHIHWTGGEVRVERLLVEAGVLWHVLAEPVLVQGAVLGRVEPAFRHLMRQLHTDLHVVNALAFQAFDGALVTGAQIGDDGTARIDLDLPGADNDRLRALEPAINDVIRQDLAVRQVYVPSDVAAAEPGLLRSRSVAPPPQADGTIRVIEIAGLDRQACGGTHLASTGQSSPVRILKIDNKGRHNRRVRIGLVTGDELASPTV